ncbi:MAG: hypothetical protein J6K13_11315 [Clostridia bacterium]|nr:hypothetical protein [Clostridia bacterium]
MNEDTRKNNPSEYEVQNSELNEEQLDEATGGMDLNVSVLNPITVDAPPILVMSIMHRTHTMCAPSAVRRNSSN